MDKLCTCLAFIWPLCLRVRPTVSECSWLILIKCWDLPASKKMSKIPKLSEKLALPYISRAVPVIISTSNQTWYPPMGIVYYWALAWVLAVPLPTLLFVNASKKVTEGSSTVWATEPIWETRMKLLAPDFHLAQPWLSRSFEELTSWWKISLSCPLSDCNFTFQIK